MYPHMTLLGREVWKLILGFSWVSPHVPVLFTDFNLCPFIVIKYSYEYNSFSSIVSPSSESLSLRVVLENPSTKVILT